MPDDTLITTLDELRDTYTARQRAANGLLTSLRGTAGALTKASRSLDDYAGGQPGTDARKLEGARQAFGALRLRDEAIDPLLPELRREVKALAATTALLRDAQAALRSDPIDVVKLGHALGGLRTGKVQDPAFDAIFPGLQRELDRGQLALGATFGGALRDAFAAQGLALGGHPPRYEVGRFQIEANFAARDAAISYGKDIVVKRVALSVERVMSAYARAAKAVSGRNEDPIRWIAQFYEAWEAAQGGNSAATGRANIARCYFEMTLLRQPKSFRSAPLKNTFVDYSRAQFAYDFYDIAIRRRTEHKGMKVAAHSATKSQTESAERSMWIVEGNGPNDGRYIADVVFSKDEQ